MMAQSLFISLKNSRPNCELHVLAPAWSLALLSRMPEITKGIANPLQHGEFNLIKRIKLGRTLQHEQYEQAIILPNSWKSALIPFFASIPLRTGYLGEFRWGLLNDVRKLDKPKLPMTVQRFVYLGLTKTAHLPPEYKPPQLTVNEESRQIVLKKFGLTKENKILALCPGAEFGPSKRWPAEYFAEIALTKLKEGWQVWLLGSEKDKQAADVINEVTEQQCRNFIGFTTLDDAVDLLSVTDAVVTNDSGLMHIAAALDKKVIALYGPTPTGFTPPLCSDAHIVTLNLPCSPCRKRICPLYPTDHPEHNKCLTGISPTQILELLPA